MSDTADAAWADALAAATILAVDPIGCGGAVLRAGAGPVRDRWVGALHGLLPPLQPWRRLPLHVADDRLLGGLDLTATLQAGRPIAQSGLLSEAAGGVLLAAMAERIEPGTAARLAAAMDGGVGGQGRFALVALDEGIEEEQPPAALLDRLAFRIDLRDIPLGSAFEPGTRDELAPARARLAAVQVSDEHLQALCGTAVVLGIDSLRAPWLALRAACAAAALAGRDKVEDDDCVLAARLVLAPRATRLPPPPEQEPAPDEPNPEPPPAPDDTPDQPPPPPPPPEPPDDAADPGPEPEPAAIEDRVLEAVQAAIPAGLLAQLQAGELASRTLSRGRAGAVQQGGARGRPAGLRRGPPQRGARLNLIETLRAAAPWQTLRQREAPARAGRLQLRADDFRVTRYRQRSQSTTVFVIDASGSQALNRLAEAKGAVELLLADCYVRRDQVAVLGFRGRGAELLLPPTRSLVRAKRSLAGLPGGGGTPLAAGLDAALQLAETIRRRGESPLLVLLTDGRANVARDGTPGRERADQEALQAADALRAAGIGGLLVDTAPRPQASALLLAQRMGARYLALPQVQASTLSQAVRAAMPAS